MKELLELIDKKIEEIESYSVDTQENEERYIHSLNSLVETKWLLFGAETAVRGLKALHYERRDHHL